MPPVEHNKISVSNFEFPPVDYPTTGIADLYAEFKNTADGYGDMKSFICFDAGFRAALQFMEKKFTSHNNSRQVRKASTQILLCSLNSPCKSKGTNGECNYRCIYSEERKTSAVL